LHSRLAVVSLPSGAIMRLAALGYSVRQTLLGFQGPQRCDTQSRTWNTSLQATVITNSLLGYIAAGSLADCDWQVDSCRRLLFIPLALPCPYLVNHWLQAP
jgi:hypothetical protein